MEHDSENSSASLRKFQKELNTGTVSLVVLGVMGDATEPKYGYQIVKYLEGMAEGPRLMKQGTLYPVLRSMERAGLLESEVEPSVSGPPRRYYQITDHGREMLAIWSKAWDRTRDFVEAILNDPTRGTEVEDGDA